MFFNVLNLFNRQFIENKISDNFLSLLLFISSLVYLTVCVSILLENLSFSIILSYLFDSFLCFFVSLTYFFRKNSLFLICLNIFLLKKAIFSLFKQVDIYTFNLKENVTTFNIIIQLIVVLICIISLIIFILKLKGSASDKLS